MIGTPIEDRIARAVQDANRTLEQTWTGNPDDPRVVIVGVVADTSYYDPDHPDYDPEKDEPVPGEQVRWAAAG